MLEICKTFFILQKKNATDPLKTASNTATPKIAEATGDFVGNKTADKIANK